MATWHWAKWASSLVCIWPHWVAMAVSVLLQVESAWFAHCFIAVPCVEPVPRAATARRVKRERELDSEREEEKMFKLC